MMNPFYRPTHNTPIPSSDEPMPPSAWAFLMVYHLLFYLAYALVWLWARGFELFWLGAAAFFLGLFVLTSRWLYQMVNQMTSNKQKAVLTLLGNGLIILLVMAMAPWVLPVHFLLACVVSMGVTALVHILVAVKKSRQRRWCTIGSVQEIVRAGRYRLGAYQVEIDPLGAGYSLLLTSDDQQAEYRFANLPTLRLYLDTVLPRS
ncbi:MAG: hypothetical protein KA314_28380 [Chloroflexi bacterium]|nr:hypothetical protein [Chloroflexota bacterium]MBP8059773.1 hypothetical protein [Chloroflexota bacterium]